MMTIEILGQCDAPSSQRCEYLTLAFSPLNTPLSSRWRNNGLSADFLGDCVITFLPSSGGCSLDARQDEIRHAVTYVANELLENAMKYHERQVNIPIGIQLELASDHIRVSASNGIGADQAEHYKQFAEQILREDAGDLITRQLEEIAMNVDATASCLGLLTMISDYRAELGWRFEAHPSHSEMMTVTTSAVLQLKNFSGVCA